jgi:hypothetical protein
LTRLFVRVSPHTIALYSGSPVLRSHINVVSLWLHKPTAIESFCFLEKKKLMMGVGYLLNRGYHGPSYQTFAQPHQHNVSPNLISRKDHALSNYATQIIRKKSCNPLIILTLDEDIIVQILAGVM